MKKLCVIFGGVSSEHDISIITAMQLRKIYQLKENLEMIYIGLDNKFYLASNVQNLSQFENKDKLNLKEVVFVGNTIYKKGFILKKYCDIECVINCCHGGFGENGDLSGFFAVNGIKHTNSCALASHIAMDKNLTKTLLNDQVPTIKGVLVKKSDFEEQCLKIEKELTEDLIVKPNTLGSSIGVKACNKENFKQHILAIFEMNDDALVEERVVDIAEYNQACFRDENKLILSAIERPLTKSEFLTFEDKYSSNNKMKGKDREIPANISKKLEQKINEYTRLVYSKLNINGVARIDYIYDTKSHQLYFNEINTVPGSMAFYLYEPIGIDYISLVDLLVKNATQPQQFKYFNTGILNNKSI